MKCRILQPFTVKTSRDILELQAGQIITLPGDKAISLIEAGKITPDEKVSYKIYSELLECYLWVVHDSEELKALRAKGIKSAIYTYRDISELRKLPKEDIRDIHNVKEAFPMSEIEEIKNNAE